MAISLKQLLVPMMASRPVTAVATRILGFAAPIFMVHRMANEGDQSTGRITATHLHRCLQYLSDNKYDLVSLEQLIQGLNGDYALPPKPVIFTMDDGFADQAEIAAPIFLEHKCPVTFFVISGMLDKRTWPSDAQVSWIIDSSERRQVTTNVAGKALCLDLGDLSKRRRARHLLHDLVRNMDPDLIPGTVLDLSRDAGVTLPACPPAAYRPMGWKMARHLEEQGIRFAPHSVSHHILSRLDRKTMEIEIMDSFEALRTHLRDPLKVFCYPRGRKTDFGPREVEVLKKAGFSAAVTSTPGHIRPNAAAREQLFALPRLALPTSMTDFVQYCTWIESAKSRFRRAANPT